MCQVIMWVWFLSTNRLSVTVFYISLFQPWQQPNFLSNLVCMLTKYKLPFVLHFRMKEFWLVETDGKLATCCRRDLTSAIFVSRIQKVEESWGIVDAAGLVVITCTRGDVKIWVQEIEGADLLWALQDLHYLQQYEKLMAKRGWEQGCGRQCMTR